MSVSSSVSIITVPDGHSRLKPVRVHRGQDVYAGGGDELCDARVDVVVLAEEVGERDEERASDHLVTVHVTWVTGPFSYTAQSSHVTCYTIKYFTRCCR